MMAHYRRINGEKCYLSPCSLQDAEKWTEWLNDNDVTLPLGDEVYFPTSLEKVQDDIRQIVNRQDHVFTIVDCETETAIGRCLYFGLDMVNRSSMMGIFIGEKTFWNRSYGQEATCLLLDYGFNLLNLHSVMLGVFSFNERAIWAYRKVGFKEIGRRREARVIAGKRYDVLFMDILEDEFRALHGPSTIARI
jgi:RimJ/RimL family protein N-acetyltransferase